MVWIFPQLHDNGDGDEAKLWTLIMATTILTAIQVIFFNLRDANLKRAPSNTLVKNLTTSDQGFFCQDCTQNFFESQFNFFQDIVRMQQPVIRVRSCEESFEPLGGGQPAGLLQVC